MHDCGKSQNYAVQARNFLVGLNYLDYDDCKVEDEDVLMMMWRQCLSVHDNMVVLIMMTTMIIMDR